MQRKTYEEAAEELKISKHTVKEYLSGAIISIREYIKQHPEYSVIFFSAFLFDNFFL
jgi:RNA polymerase sigma-70 factor (ECF subfamily)